MLPHGVELVVGRGRLPAHARLHVTPAALALVGREMLVHAAERHELLRRVVAEDGRIGLVHEQRLPVPVNQDPLDRALDEVPESILAVLELDPELGVLGHQPAPP